MKEQEKKTLAIFGDCASQQIAVSHPHTRACGMTSWVSIVSGIYGNLENLSEEEMGQWGTSNFIRRLLLLDARKTALDYLLEEKADYLLLDCNDIRHGVIVGKEADRDGADPKMLCAITDRRYLGDVSRKYMDLLCADEKVSGGQEHSSSSRFQAGIT